MIEPQEFIKRAHTDIDKIEVVSIVSISDNDEVIECRPDMKPWFLIKVTSGYCVSRIVTDGDKWLGVAYRRNGSIRVHKTTPSPFDITPTTVDQRNIKRAIEWWSKTI